MTTTEIHYIAELHQAGLDGDDLDEECAHLAKKYGTTMLSIREQVLNYYPQVFDVSLIPTQKDAAA